MIRLSLFFYVDVLLIWQSKHGHEEFPSLSFFIICSSFSIYIASWLKKNIAPPPFKKKTPLKEPFLLRECSARKSLTPTLPRKKQKSLLLQNLSSGCDHINSGIGRSSLQDQRIAKCATVQQNYNTPVEHTPGNPPSPLWKESLYSLLVKV